MKMSRIAILGIVVVISAVAALQAYSYAAPQQYALGQMTTGTGSGCGQMNGQGMMGQGMMGSMNGGMMNQQQMMNGSTQQQYMNGKQMPIQCQGMDQ